MVLAPIRTLMSVAVDRNRANWVCNDDMDPDRPLADSMVTDMPLDSTSPEDVDCMVRSMWVDMLDNALDACCGHMDRGREWATVRLAAAAVMDNGMYAVAVADHPLLLFFRLN